MEVSLMWKIDKGSKAGTTTVSYVSALDWRTAELGQKTVLLKNTHASFSLKYKLLGYANDDGVFKELVKEMVLPAGEIAEFHYTRQWHRLVLQVVDGSGHASYQLDYEGQGA
jgi:hypothetical protein